MSCSLCPPWGVPEGGPAPLNPPGNFHVAATTNSSVSFAWNPVTGAIYELFNDTTGLDFNLGDVTSYTWTGLQAGDTYSFHIVAVVNNLASANSPEVTVTIPGAPPTPPAVQPATPVITSTSATTDSITVTWRESTPVSELNGYALLVNGIGALGGASAPAGATTATFTGLWPGYTFSVQVMVWSKNGVTGALTAKSASVTVTTAAGPPPPANAPAAPTGLTGSGDGGGEAIISWNPSTSVNTPQADIQYLIYIDGVVDLNDSSTASQGTTGDTTNIYIFPRGADIPAQVLVVAVDQFGNTSAPSNVLTIPYF